MSQPLPIPTLLKPSHALAREHDLPDHHDVAGHRIVVTGLYMAATPKNHESGTGGKKKVQYREEFLLRAREHKMHGQGALGHLLSDKLLAERLSKKDPNFRAIFTHTIVEHENLLKLDEAAKAKADEAAAAK